MKHLNQKSKNQGNNLFFNVKRSKPIKFDFEVPMIFCLLQIWKHSYDFRVHLQKTQFLLFIFIQKPNKFDTK